MLTVSSLKHLTCGNLFLNSSIPVKFDLQKFQSLFSVYLNPILLCPLPHYNHDIFFLRLFHFHETLGVFMALSPWFWGCFKKWSTSLNIYQASGWLHFFFWWGRIDNRLRHLWTHFQISLSLNYSGSNGNRPENLNCLIIFTNFQWQKSIRI